MNNVKCLLTQRRAAEAPCRRRGRESGGGGKGSTNFWGALVSAALPVSLELPAVSWLQSAALGSDGIKEGRTTLLVSVAGFPPLASLSLRRAEQVSRSLSHVCVTIRRSARPETRGPWGGEVQRGRQQR